MDVVIFAWIISVVIRTCFSLNPPKEGHFTSPNKSFSECEECLYAEYNKTLKIECGITDLSGEESVVIQLNALDGRKTEEKRANRTSCGRYAAAFSFLRDYNHLANVTCQVSAPTLPQPLTVTTKLYVLRRPTTPILTVGLLREGHSPNITCQSHNSRPPAKLFYKLGEQKIDVNQTNESYVANIAGNLKYRTVASIHSVERSWNNKMVTCCLEHETLDSPCCSDAMKLHYDFPPSAVHLSFTNISTTTKQNDTINVTCVVVNANPVCGAIISVNDVEISIVNVSHKQNEGGGMTTVVKASLNVVPDDDGKRVICTANCSIFATNQTDSFALELRDDSPVTSQDQNEMIVLIVVPLAAVILLGTIVVVIVVCVRRRNVSRPETNQASSTEPEGYYQTLNRAEVGQSSIYNDLELNVYANDKW